MVKAAKNIASGDAVPWAAANFAEIATFVLGNPVLSGKR